VGADALLRVEEVKLDRCVLSRAADRSGLLDGAETAEPTLTDTSPGEWSLGLLSQTSRQLSTHRLARDGGDLSRNCSRSARESRIWMCRRLADRN